MAKRGERKSKPTPKSTSLPIPKPRKDPSDFCKAMDTWAAACMTALPTDDEHKTEWRKKFGESWQFIRLAISKSCLLDRLIYGGETLRTEQCPEHRGRWSGCTFSGQITCGCGHGICVTGWLKNKTDQESHNSGLAILTLDKNNAIKEIDR